jgi:uncharacterized UPF0146 family protein
VLREQVGTDKIVEVGSGNGYWARFLTDSGLNIVATDLAVKQYKNEYHPSFLPRWSDNILEVDGLTAVQT